jgi:uncharacterized membrane protein YphA (DoxX/SURF4 family)
MHLIGRILFSMLFIGSGLNHLLKAKEMASYAQSKGVPAAKVVTVVSGLMIVVGGVLVLLGWHRFIGAGLIGIFVLGTAVFMKDLGLLGAALFFAFYAGTSWPMSLGG